MINSNDNNNNNKIHKESKMESDNGDRRRRSPAQSANNNDDNTYGLSKLPIESREFEGVRYGKCKWFNVAKGWGFITPNDGGREVFVHQSVIQMDGFRSLGEQEDVEYECHMTERGIEATRVSGRQGHDCHGSTYRPNTKLYQRRVRCYNCGKYANHIASKCHLGPQPKRCHSCLQDDHLFAECPTRESSAASSPQHSAKYRSSFARKHNVKNEQDTTNEGR